MLHWKATTATTTPSTSARTPPRTPRARRRPKRGGASESAHRIHQNWAQSKAKVTTCTKNRICLWLWSSECWLILHQASWSRDWSKFGRCQVRSTIFGHPFYIRAVVEGPNHDLCNRNGHRQKLRCCGVPPRSQKKKKLGGLVRRVEQKSTWKWIGFLSPVWDTVQREPNDIEFRGATVYLRHYWHVIWPLCSLFCSPCPLLCSILLCYCFQHRTLKAKLINTFFFFRSVLVLIQVKHVNINPGVDMTLWANKPPPTWKDINHLTHHFQEPQASDEAGGCLIQWLTAELYVM